MSHPEIADTKVYQKDLIFWEIRMPFMRTFVDKDLGSIFISPNPFPMKGLMMDYQLTVPVIVKRVETFFGHKQIVTRQPDKSLHRCTYADVTHRSKKLSVALKKLGIKEGDRVATFCWNHYQHLEIYFAVPSMGAVLHTLNLRLSADDLEFIVNHAEDSVLIIDQGLLPLFEKFRSKVKLKYVIVIPNLGQPVGEGFLNYEDLLKIADEKDFVPFEGDENTAAAMCYTSGTTGKPKGVLYSHRSIVLHSMVGTLAEGLGIKEEDIVLPVVPMFHVNAWGLPYSCAMSGTSLVFPGPHLDPPSLLELFEKETVTITAGVPTIWLGILNILDANPDKYNLSALHTKRSLYT